VVLGVAALLASACSNRASEPGGSPPSVDQTGAPPEVSTPALVDDSSVGATTDSSDPLSTDAPGEMFGDLPSPCGPGQASIAEGQNGGDELVLATASDRGASVAPGLTQEMYDAAVAFAEWCNEQGGIGGLPIRVLDADGKLFEVPAAMEQVCDQAFAMVGGGWAFDDQQFPRFHECGMIDIAGYTVSTAKAMSDGMAQPLPNPSNRKNIGWFTWAQANHPDAIRRTATLYPDILSTQIVEQQFVEAMGAVDGFEIVERIPYSAAGEANWAVFAQRLRDLGVTTLVFVGSAEQFVPFIQATAEIGYRPELTLLEANLYSPQVLDVGGASEGVVLRLNITPFEEADRSPAISRYLEIMETYRPEGKLGGLGVQGMSAFLLFAVGANACLAANDGVLERQCVLSAVQDITGWTGGGLHAPTNPGQNEPTRCTLLMVVDDGEFRRLWPEIGGPDDDGNGFACDPSWVVDLAGDYGDVNAGRKG
jgi:ABC-type branched-subunit amino acid transport system substrate-binding protein